MRDGRARTPGGKKCHNGRRGHEVCSHGLRGSLAHPDTAQLVKPKKFGFIWALVWFLLFGIGLIVYLLYYWGKRDQTVYLEVDNRGVIQSPYTAVGTWNS
jgi:hypothetical protein